MKKIYQGRLSLKLYYLILPILFILMVGWSHQNADQAVSIPSMSEQGNSFFKLLKSSEAFAEDASGKIIPSEQLLVKRVWQGNTCKISIKNIGKQVLHPANVMVFNLNQHGLDPSTPVYGEGFQMLDQKGGRLDSLVHIGPYPDEK